MNRAFPAFALSLIFILVGCAQVVTPPSSLPPGQQPTSVRAGDTVRITGENLFEALTAGYLLNLRVELCGTTLIDPVVEGTDWIVTVPGGAVRIRTGNAVTGVLGSIAPAAAGLSDLIVILPDGVRLQVEDAYTCEA